MAPLLRVDQLEIMPSVDPATLYPYVLGFDLSTRIKVILTEASISEEYFIEGIDLTWKQVEPENMRVVWQLSNATNAKFPTRQVDTLHPNAAGDSTELVPTTPPNWQCVVTAGSGEDVHSSGTDYYNLTNVASLGLALEVTVTAEAWKTISATLVNHIKVGGTTYNGVTHTLTGSPANYSDTFNLPATLTLADINAMQAGITSSDLTFQCDEVKVDFTQYTNW